MNAQQEYKEVLMRGIRERANIEAALEELTKKPIDSVFFVGCGGSLAVMYPLQYLMSLHTSLLAVPYNSSEFLNMKPKALTERSLVILSSYTGTTKETVDAAEMARAKGARTLAFAGKADTPLGKAVDYIFANDAPSGVTDSKLIMLYQIVFCLLDKLGFNVGYELLQKELSFLPEGLARIRELAKAEAQEFAEKNHDQTFFMVTGSGINWGEAYSYAMCILQEMQWIPAQSVHAGEFFHGAFEILQEDTNLLIFQGEDETRPLTERVVAFAEQYTRRAHLIDTKNYPLDGIAPERRGIYGPFILLAVLNSYSDALAERRQHPLKTRRYMGKVTY